MPVLDVTIVGKMYLPEVGGGPIYPPGQPPSGEPPHPAHPWVPPLGIWGPTDPRPMPPIYIPVPPPGGNGDAHPEHPIYIPVYPAHPIVLPIPPSDAHPEHPIYYPPVVWPPLPPKPGEPAHPIYIPIYPAHPIVVPPPGEQPPSDAHPEHPIYFPVYPSHPIVLPPDGETPPQPPPGMINPPSGMRGFWVYSEMYQCWVFVPYAGVEGPGGGVQPPATAPGR